MESDLSLIEISGEDDSLLQQTPSLHDTTTAAAANYCFSCSPLQIPGSTLNSHRSFRFSPIMGLKDNAGIEEPSCSTPIGSSNKENMNVKKSEVPKLSVESQQMKRRKRPGAYNLRKSLAWDRAFFTEEGVLNSLELSMLSGSIGNSSREVLPTIHEEGRKMSGNSGSNSDSAVLQVLEENLFKETHATNSNERDNGGSLLMKHVSSARDNAAPASAGMPKMLSSQRGNRTRSKSGGCPRPVVFPSLKRPANASTTKSAMKESKIPKIPASRSGAHSLPKSNQNNVLSTSHSKHNQIGQTDIVQKSARIQDPFKNTKSSANKAKAGSDSSSLSAKSPLQHPRRNMRNSNLEVRLSTNPHPPLVTKANCGLEVFPAAVLPPTGSHAPDAHDLYWKTGVVPQNTHYIGGNMRDTQFQTIKPSGLRMPSPSLGFFCQPKSSASNSSYQKATQPSNIPKSYIPGLQRFNVSNYTHDPRLLHAPEKMPKMDNNATVSGNSRVSGSSTECSLPSAYSDASHENVELKIEGSNALTMETMLPCYPKSSELMKDNQQEHKIVGGDKGFQGCGEPHKDDQSSKEDSDFEKNYDDWLLQSRSSDQLKKDSNNEVAISCPEFIYSKIDELEDSNFASQRSCAVLVKGVPEANDTIKHQHVENKQCSSSVGTREVISGCQTEYAAGDIKQAFVIMHNDSSSDIHVDEWSTLKDELINASAGKADQIPRGENPNLVRNDRILLEDGKLFESQKYKRENDATVNSNICKSNGSEKLSSNSPPHESTEQANEGAAGVDQLNDKLHAEDGQVNFLDETLFIKNCDNKLCTSEVHDQYLVVDDNNNKTREHPKLQSCHLLVEQASELNHGFLVDDSSFCSSEESSFSVKRIQTLANETNAMDIGVDKKNTILPDDNERRISQENVNPGELQHKLDDALCSSEESGSSVKRIQTLANETNAMDIGVDKRNSILPDDNELRISQENVNPGELQHKLDDAICSSEESGFSVKRIQTLANETNAMDIGVDKRNSILPDDNELRISQENVNPGELQHKLDDAICSSEESGFSVKRIRTLANETNAMDIGVDKRNSILPDDNELRISQENVNPGELQHKLDDAICSSEESGFSVKRIQTLANETNAMDIGVDKRSSILPDDNELRISQENVNPGELQHKLDDAICSSEESGFSVKRIQTLANETNAMDIGVDKRNSILPDDNELGISQENVNPGELQHKLDDANCSSEESGFSVKKFQTLANETNVMDIGVDKSNIILPNDNELGISQENVNPGELQRKLDDAICFTEDEDRTMPIKKLEDDEKQNNPMINPTVNAVPFSDEWLAAMEAAGEKILTMKSGAVQNSPPDKSLPEPGPWSPVRKQNSIGPFDCTKFVNIPPPNSD